MEINRFLAEPDRFSVWEALTCELLDEVILGFCFEMHRSCKRGTLFLDEIDDESQRHYEIVNVRGLDVFGHVLSTKKQYDCVCPNCRRSLAASRFAPHLEKCIGMGGASLTRIARRRVPTVAKKTSDVESDDNSSDNDWTYNASRTFKKLRRTGSQKKKNAKRFEERKSILHKICGVVSEHTKKMCTRSVKCPQHTDEQRLAVRCSLLHDSSGLMTDVDETIMMKSETRTRHSLTTCDDLLVSTSPATADSCSTPTSGSGSQYRDKQRWTRKTKKKSRKIKTVAS